MANEKKYTLTLTEEQLKALRWACCNGYLQAFDLAEDNKKHASQMPYMNSFTQAAKEWRQTYELLTELEDITDLMLREEN